MSLKAVMAADISNVFLNLGDFAENCTFLPDGQSPGFAAVVALGDVADQVVLADTGENDQQRVLVLGLLSALTSGIMTQTGNTRNPRRGDKIAFAQGVADPSLVGTWTLESANPDNGGGVNMQLRLERRHALGSKGTIV